MLEEFAGVGRPCIGRVVAPVALAGDWNGGIESSVSISIPSRVRPGTVMEDLGVLVGKGDCGIMV